MANRPMPKDRESVYIETSVVSYLTARPTKDLLGAVWQSITVDWWDTQRTKFTLCTSDVTLVEAGRGHPDAAQRRLDALADVPRLTITDSVSSLSKALLHASALPSNAEEDSLHVAISSVHGVDYLLTWNFRHIDNARTKPIMRDVCRLHGYSCPEICTPIELMEVSNDG